MNLLIIFIIGLLLGSFLNVVIFRLHEKKNFITGRSFCLKCRKQIYWYDNIPLLSFILLRGKCRRCHAPISWQYPAVEIVTAVLFVLTYINFQFSIFNFQTISNVQIFNFQFIIHNSKFLIQLLRDWLFICILIIIFVYDLRWYLILDSVTVPAIILAFAVNIWLGFDWLNLLLAAALGGGFFLFQFIVSRGRWVGAGDIRLGALLGCMLGFPWVLVTLFIAYISGAAVGIGLLAAGKKQLSSPLPFGTFLSAATAVTLLWGEEILNWYLNYVF